MNMKKLWTLCLLALITILCSSYSLAVPCIGPGILGVTFVDPTVVPSIGLDNLTLANGVPRKVKVMYNCDNHLNPLADVPPPEFGYSIVVGTPAGMTATVSFTDPGITGFVITLTGVTNGYNSITATVSTRDGDYSTLVLPIRIGDLGPPPPPPVGCVVQGLRLTNPRSDFPNLEILGLGISLGQSTTLRLKYICNDFTLTDIPNTVLVQNSVVGTSVSSGFTFTDTFYTGLTINISTVTAGSSTLSFVTTDNRFTPPKVFVISLPVVVNANETPPEPSGHCITIGDTNLGPAIVPTGAPWDNVLTEGTPVSVKVVYHCANAGGDRLEDAVATDFIGFPPNGWGKQNTNLNFALDPGTPDGAGVYTTPYVATLTYAATGQDTIYAYMKDGNTASLLITTTSAVIAGCSPNGVKLFYHHGFGGFDPISYKSIQVGQISPVVAQYTCVGGGYEDIPITIPHWVTELDTSKATVEVKLLGGYLSPNQLAIYFTGISAGSTLPRFNVLSPDGLTQFSTGLNLVITGQAVAPPTNTSLHVQVKDSTGQMFVGGTYTVETVSPAGYSGSLNTETPADLSTRTGPLDTSGSFDIILYRNDAIVPSGSYYRFTFCANADDKLGCFITNFKALSNTPVTQVFYKPVQIKVFTDPPLRRAYSDEEVYPPRVGGIYYNTLTDCVRVQAKDGGFFNMGCKSMSVLGVSGIPIVNKATCWKTPTTMGYCSSAIDATGSCTCN